MTETPSAPTPDLRYPVGRFQAPEKETSREQREQWILALERMPSELRARVESLADAQLDAPYRPGGWTIRQLVHHLADSHLNSYVRFRLGLTEEKPTIKTYSEAAWAELADAKTAPIALSLPLIGSLHQRWVLLLRSMSDADFAREINHPEWGTMRLDRMLALYAWHCRHHLAHIDGFLGRSRV
jgi:uncharacterized damage-inducible protein DinB